NSGSRGILEYLHEHLPKDDLEGRMGVLFELIEYYKKEQQWEKIIALIDQYPETTDMHLLLEKRECYKRLGRFSDAINVNLTLTKAHPYEDNFQLETNRLLLMRVRPDIRTFDSK
ncbi:MAG: hypothetical protein KDK65_08005, partial [Chlamydiia bacterium]|nr:hypothetical protein [Chlamydiia bacterium]